MRTPKVKQRGSVGRPSTAVRGIAATKMNGSNTTLMKYERGYGVEFRKDKCLRVGERR
jgi:hypothetical protein